MSGVLAAHQPNYAPYPGILHKAAQADVFVVQDDLKYIKNDYGNRNRVQSEDTWRWLTIPVHADNSSLFNTATAADPRWGASHANILRAKYRTARHFDRLLPYLEHLAGERSAVLSQINFALLTKLLAEFEIATPVVLQSDLELGPFENPNDRLIALCHRFDCDTYVSGLGGRAYIEEDRWVGSGVTLTWSDYEAVRYDRGDAPWEPNLSAFDAIAHADEPASLIPN